MINLFQVRRLGAFALVAATAAILGGCGGSSSSGGGGGGVTGPDVIKNNGTFGGSIVLGPLSANAALKPGAAATSFTIRLGDTTGSAAFKSGNYGDTTFVSYTADITNIVATASPTQASAGTIAFDMVNFTSGSPYKNLHWAGTYQWNQMTGAAAALSMSGAITGQTVNSTAVSASFTMDYFFFPNIVTFTGPWHGDISVPTKGTPTWAGSFDKIDDTHTNVHIIYGTSTIVVPAVTTNTSLAGDFDGSQFLTGAVGHFYMERDPQFNDNTHLIGGYTVTLEGTPLGAGIIHAVAGTVSAPALTTGYYTGTATASGKSPVPFDLDLLHLGATVGVQGAIVTPPAATPLQVGARILSVTGSGANTVVSIGDIGLSNVTPSLSSKYSAIVLTGTPTDTTYIGSYAATLTVGGTETGTFTFTKETAPTRFNVAGTWSGTATGQGGQGTPTGLLGTITQSEDEFTFTATQNVSGSMVTFPVKGYIVGPYFIGNAINQAVTVNTISGTITGHFEGVMTNATTINGSFVYLATVPGLGSVGDGGTFNLTKD